MADCRQYRSDVFRQLKRHTAAAAVILAGGHGTRLWPLSRTRKPKQFQEFKGGSLLRLTVDRVAEHVPRSRIYVSTTAALRTAVLDSGCRLDDDHLILESSPAGPATAFALGVTRIHRAVGDVPTLICPSDHYFSSEDAVHAALDKMFTIEAEGGPRPTVMGVRADSPNTRLGYFRTGGTTTGNALEVVEIREKPSATTAQALIDEGAWYWNTACYLVRPSPAIEVYRASHREVMELILRGADGTHPYDGPPVPGHEMAPFFDARSFPRLVPLEKGWSDVGNWETFLAASGDGTEATPQPAPIQLSSARTAVFNETDKVVVTIGTKDLVIIVHDDAVFVMDRGSAVDPEVIQRSRSMVADQGMDNLL